MYAMQSFICNCVVYIILVYNTTFTEDVATLVYIASSVYNAILKLK